MGRSKRRRQNKNKQIIIKRLNTEQTIIDLNRWMKVNSWTNENKLEIAHFPETGRGIITKKRLDCGDIIIEVPFNIMISYATLEKSNNFKTFLSSYKEKFTIHEMLCLYLVLQKHLNVRSFWHSYIQSLPTIEDLTILWYCSDKEMSCLNEELLTLVKREKNVLEESWVRVKLLLQSQYTCYCCNKRGDIIITRDLYIWAHTLVNTRSVYVAPSKVRNLCTKDLSHILEDEPSMALCPFLDMFNHSSDTHTTAYLSDYNENYFLVSNSNFKKYEQVFISYGAHDNKRLIYQYGFVVQINENDLIEFKFQDILNILNYSASSRQCKFLCDRDLDKYNFISITGCSFNLTAVLYVLSNEDELDWTVRIFSAEYTKEMFCTIYTLSKKLLILKLNQLKTELDQKLLISENFSRHFKLYFEYLNNEINFVLEVIRRIEIKYKV